MLTLHIKEIDDTISLPKIEFDKLVANQKEKKFDDIKLIRLDISQFCGILDWGKDAVEYQREIRNEWQ